MKRSILLIILIILCYVLQVSVFSYFKLAGITPNIMLILVVSVALLRGQTEGMITGFICGLIMDIMSGGTIGLLALYFLVTGYINGIFQKLLFVNNTILPLGFIFANSVIYNLFIYIVSFLLRNRTDYLFYFRHVIIPEVVYTFVIAILLFNILLGLNNILEKTEKRGAE